MKGGLSGLIEESLATKRDLKEFENNFNRDLKELELRLSVRLGTIVAAGIAGVAAVVKLLSH
ncbi:MAG: hypothetical protein HQK95_05525 [Nitrospirae bacterium]|nr:hypothetical protein [Nitrospirota bacterium]